MRLILSWTLARIISKQANTLLGTHKGQFVRGRLYLRTMLIGDRITHRKSEDLETLFAPSATTDQSVPHALRWGFIVEYISDNGGFDGGSLRVIKILPLLVVKHSFCVSQLFTKLRMH
jgi:hypothetical protein